jgi:hypothetical protein
MKFAYSILARTHNHDNVRHCLGLVNANSKYEAAGKVLAIAEKVYSPGRWKIDSIMTVDVEKEAIEPENCDLIDLDGEPK